ncbi:MAG: C4-dicarboxylate transporter DctA [Myxococcaceae bacterium]
MTGLVGGAIAGLVLAWSDAALAIRVADVVQPFGRLWLSALQMTVVPLVLALVIVGVNAASDAAHSGRVARRAITIFLVLLSAGSAAAAILSPLALSVLTPDPAVAAALRGSSADLPATGGWADVLAAIIPSNAIAAAAQSAMLPVVVFALFFGFALTRIDAVGRAQVVSFFKAIADAMIVIVRWVLWVAPAGVFALTLSLTARAGLGVLRALGIYILLECALYLVATVLLVAVAVLVARQRLSKFLAGLAPVQAVAASTQSSLASLPAMLESSERQLGFPQHISSLVLPMAVSLFRITSPIQYLATATFVAWALGVNLSVGHLAAGAALAVVVSLGSVGLPGQAIFVATNLPVAQAMGVPVAPLAVLMAVDAIPDVLATVGNVTGDMTANALVVSAHERG